MLDMLGYVKASDLIIIHPEIAAIIEKSEQAAKELNARGVTLQKEAESKLITASDYQATAKRKLDAIARFRHAIGEKK